MTFSVGGSTIDLPAVHQAQGKTADRAAWANGFWRTVRLIDDLETLRVHTDGRRIDDRAVDPSGAVGRWLLIGDVIHTSSQIVQGRALPGLFTNVTRMMLRSGTVLNIGLCGPLFGFPGGGWQGEYVSGPQMEPTNLPSVWMNRAANA